MDRSAATPLAHRVWPGPSPAAPTVLLLNTAFGRVGELDELAVAVSRRANVVGVEFREGAERDEEPVRSVEVDARRTALLMDALALQRPAVVALCYGSLVAIELAVRFPGRTRQIALCEPLVVAAPGFMAKMESFLRAPAGTAGREAGIAGLYDAFFEAEFVERNRLAHRLNRVLFVSEWRRERSFAWLRATIAGQHRYVRDVGARLVALREAARSVCLVVGERDALVSAADVQALATAIGARCRVLPSAGHAIHVEQSARLSAAVLDWLSDGVEERP